MCPCRSSRVVSWLYCVGGGSRANVRRERYSEGWLSHSIGDLAVQRRDSRRLAPSRLGRALTHICRYGDGGWHLFHGRSSTRTRTMSVVVETMLHRGRTAPQPPGWEAAARPSVSGQDRAGQAASSLACLIVGLPLPCPAPFHARSLCPRIPMGDIARFPGDNDEGGDLSRRGVRVRCFCACALPVLVCV